MKRMKRVLCAGCMMWMLLFSVVVHAENTAGVFQLPFSETEAWPNCAKVGYKFPADQIFMEWYDVRKQYHLAEDWNGKCGSSTDRHGELYAIADGVVENMDSTGSDGYGKLLLIKHSLPDETSRYVLYEHIQDIAINPRTGRMFANKDSVFRGEQVASIGDDGIRKDAAHLHFEMWRNLFPNIQTPPYYNPLSVETAMKYSSPSLFIDDRRDHYYVSLHNNEWTGFVWSSDTQSVPMFNAPSSTAFIEFRGERYSLPRAVEKGLLDAEVYSTDSNTSWPYQKISDVFFYSGKTYYFQSSVEGATLNILLPGNRFQADRAKIDMIRTVSVNPSFKNVDPNPATEPTPGFKLYKQNTWFDFYWTRFIYNDGSGDRVVYANQATYKFNPLWRWVTYYDPVVRKWTGWKKVDPNILD